MIERVEIRTTFGKTLILPMRSSVNGLYVMDLDGLDPTKANIVTTSFARRDGTQQQASRRESRYPKIVLGFDPNFDNQTVESLRNELFRILMTKTQVELRYFTESGLGVKINGEVETFVSPRMSEDPDATITIHCPEPDFVGLAPKVVTDFSVDNESIGVLDYDGSVETGFLMNFFPAAASGGFTLTNIADDGRSHILEFTQAILPGDKVVISTVAGSKGAWLERAGSRTSALQGVSSFADWVNLYPGANRINVREDGGGSEFTIEYSDKYGGI